MTQPQREALIDLLLLAIHTDSHISLSEEAALETALAAQGWASERPKSLYLETAAARARAAAESAEATTAFVHSRAAVFDTAHAQTAAYNVVHQVISPDGVAPAEHTFLRLLNDAFPTPRG